MLHGSHPRLSEVSPFIENLTTHLEDTFRDPTSIGYKRYNPVISYWNKVMEQLECIQPLQDENLRGDFRPQKNQGTGFTLAQRHQGATWDGPEDDIIVTDELQQELLEENNLMLQPYVGNPADRQAMGPVMRQIDDEHHGQFLVEWWMPKHRKSTNATNKERYVNVLVGLKDWERDRGYFTPQWMNATAAVYSWKDRSKGGVPQTARLNPLAKAAIE
ncbi:hypothetical protein R1sor_009009 [Riccia sorocarpa]|uniref:Uncharacterized protein n=1 Tax=Riccia sorocarpa TaxID=122646 RepID=A0ABD3H826_9MARC